jgi:enterobactin synthetase component D / holo-[acyl-carrier protein] synthase
MRARCGAQRRRVACSPSSLGALPGRARRLRVEWSTYGQTCANHTRHTSRLGLRAPLASGSRARTPAPGDGVADERGRMNPIVSELLPAILPDVVEVCESFDTEHDEEPCFPEEEVALAAAGPVRRRDFIAVRICARQAMARLGQPPRPLLPGPSGAPVWPPGIVGSMTHCSGYRAAAVARPRVVAGLGIDAEPHVALAPEVVEVTCREEELAGLPDDPRDAIHWSTILFSAKESVYKTWYPLVGTWLDFHDVRISLAVDGTFTVAAAPDRRPVGSHMLSEFRGSWAVNRGLVATSVLLPPSRDTRRRA